MTGASFGRQVIRVLVLCGVLSPALSPARQWTDKWGRKFEAEVLKVDGKQVTFVVGGRQRPVALKNLSEADIRFLEGGGRGGPVRRGPLSGELKSGSVEGLKGGFAPDLPHIAARIDLPVKLVQQDAAAGRWVYRSAHFEFVSDAFLGTDVVRDFSWVFEATLDYVSKLPMRLPRIREAGQRPMRTYLFETYEAYLRAGGSPGSGGV